jgi:rod shape-determining protein MreD
MFEYLQLAILWLARRVWFSLPLLTTLVAVLVTMAPANLFFGLAPAPDFALASIFYWAIYGPAFLPAWAVFFIGLATDFTVGTPPGFWALIYLLAYGFTISQRVFFTGRSGPGILFGFTMVAMFAAAVAWLLGSMTYARWIPPGQIIAQAAMSALFYPLIARVFSLIRRTLTTAREAI